MDFFGCHGAMSLFGKQDGTIFFIIQGSEALSCQKLNWTFHPAREWKNTFRFTG
jgi:hypothetical protein